MERTTWTNERLDDLAQSVRAGFARNDAEHREMRIEIRDGFAQVRAEIDSLRQTMIRIGGGMLIGFITVLGAIIARGA
jgi:argininosuccinate lyase